MKQSNSIGKLNQSKKDSKTFKRLLGYLFKPSVKIYIRFSLYRNKRSNRSCLFFIFTSFD